MCGDGSDPEPCKKNNYVIKGLIIFILIDVVVMPLATNARFIGCAFCRTFDLSCRFIRQFKRQISAVSNLMHTCGYVMLMC